MDFEIERRASFEKQPGFVQLSGTHLVWTPDSAAEGRDLNVAFTAVRTYQISKAGGKKAMIRIQSNDRATPIMLDFGTGFGDRDAIRDVLNRRLTPAGAANATVGSDPIPEPALVAPAQPSIDWSALPIEERKKRELLLRKKEIRALHMRLVVSGIVDDDKFWRGMKCKYKDNGQRRGASVADEGDDEDGAVSIGTDHGVPSAAFDSSVERAAAGDHGAVKWAGDMPSVAERHRVFMEHPAVSLAFRAKVLDARPGALMSEAAFWAVYKQSSMAQKHIKGTKRAAAVATEADAMFAEFHASVQQALEAEEKQRAAAVDGSLNLSRFDDHRTRHVTDGHAAGGEAPRGTKRRAAGGKVNAAEESRGLALMRQLNRHGAMVVESDGIVGLGSSTGRDGGSIAGNKAVDPAASINCDALGAWREDEDERVHPLRHLEQSEQPIYASLALGDERAFIAARTTSGISDKEFSGARAESESLRAAALEFGRGLQGWQPNLGRLGQDGCGIAGIQLAGILAKMKP
jgi:TFIIH p62 subunit, N-terminal domain